MPAFVVALTVIPASAKATYRGFLDFYGGVTFGTNIPKDFPTSPYGSTETNNRLDFAFTTTHGVQINKFLFLGVGVGVQGIKCPNFYYSLYDLDTAQGKYNIYDSTDSYLDNVFSVPGYVDLRWDINLTKRATPFIDLRAGYNFMVGNLPKWRYRGEVTANGERIWPLAAEFITQRFYFQPTVGLRIRAGRRAGVGLGVTYMPVYAFKFYYYSGKEMGKTQGGSVMLNLGLDF